MFQFSAAHTHHHTLTRVYIYRYAYTHIPTVHRPTLLPSAIDLFNNKLDSPMTPSTPPRSTAMDTDTPRIHIPQTPSTIQKRPLLAPPKLAINNNLKSPEYSPLRRNSIHTTPFAAHSGLTRTDDDFSSFIDNDNDKRDPKQNVARCLFPMSEQQLDDNDKNLLPQQVVTKKSRTEPGTPSDKLITEDRLGSWLQEDQEHPNDWDTDDETDIVPVQLDNPFAARKDERALTQQERKQRHQDLIRDNPDIVDTITYIDKRGHTIKRRAAKLNSRALFQDQDPSA